MSNAIDGTERWWQSPPLSRGLEYNEVNVTLDLGQVQSLFRLPQPHPVSLAVGLPLRHGLEGGVSTYSRLGGRAGPGTDGLLVVGSAQTQGWQGAPSIVFSASSWFTARREARWGPSQRSHGELG